MARAISNGTIRGVAPETRAVCTAGKVGSVPLGGAENKDGAMGEELNGSHIWWVNEYGRVWRFW